MHKFLPVLVFLATASTFCQASAAGEPRAPSLLNRLSAAEVSGYGGALVLVGGMGGTGGGGMGGTGGGGMGGAGTGGGMGGMTGGGMGGMTGGGMGGMTSGGVGDMTGGGGMTGVTGRGIGGTSGYSDAPSGGGDPYGRSETTGDGPQRPQSYHCVTQHGQCSVTSALGSLRTGASCSCLYGGSGKIK